ncbi:cyclase family protein [Mycobacterium sp. 94-17]|uniref:cyclase family protein n=1 Tax=Mycobacterium sp. 94-17 TaxID=2986147 RepID=UPI002D1F501E|nr:cyclase family protein [Mycobacterium sp. 94-17]MEB4209720.1 cyclase family protein [Mycobacterium sp. 94-17]
MTRADVGTTPAWAELPNGNAAGVFGDDDLLGRLNTLTPERVLAAARLVQTGRVINLNGSILDWPNPSPFGLEARKPPQHHVTKYAEVIRDEYYDGFYPQGGSQWDGFLHGGDPMTNKFYNNIGDDVGIAAWAERGIVGRGVLLDVARYREKVGAPNVWCETNEISVDELERCAADQGVTPDEGTILAVRTGWQTGYKALDKQGRIELAKVEKGPHCVGLEASAEMAARIWDWGVAAVGSDNPTVEAWPPKTMDMLHFHLLGRLGIPLGEYWLVDELAEACAAEQRYEFLFVAAPLNAPGAVGSTANALAIL